MVCTNPDIRLQHTFTTLIQHPYLSYDSTLSNNLIPIQVDEHTPRLARRAFVRQSSREAEDRDIAVEFATCGSSKSLLRWATKQSVRQSYVHAKHLRQTFPPVGHVGSAQQVRKVLKLFILH